MRLINIETLEFHEFYPSETPPYAILSHTWGRSEVTFQDMLSRARYPILGYAKIRETCRLAGEDDLGYVWIDTCCIDKSSSAELSESINSMFKWYRDAVICYVMLEDLSPNDLIEDMLARCRWLTRGWTLQELLAPKEVRFYDSTWSYRGSKVGLRNAISTTSGIPREALLNQKLLKEYPVATRMAWAAHRETTRVEDIAYCLLGIFDVNMSLIYGEGLKAFRRLQEEIIKGTNDLTIFAWDAPKCTDTPSLNLFATTPSAFADSPVVKQYTRSTEFSVTNKGLLVSGDQPLTTAFVDRSDSEDDVLLYYLCLGSASPFEGGIFLRQLAPMLYFREGSQPLAGFGRNLIRHAHMEGAAKYHIIIDQMPSQLYRSLEQGRTVLHVPSDCVFRLSFAAPKVLWNVTDRTFLGDAVVTSSKVLAMAFDAPLENRVFSLVVLCKAIAGWPICKMFLRAEHRRQAAMIFNGKHHDDPIAWADLEFLAPELLDIGDSVDLVTDRNEIVHVEVSVVSKQVKTSFSIRNKEMSCVEFYVTRQHASRKRRDGIDETTPKHRPARHRLR